MNSRLLVKLLVILMILLFMVMMGKANVQEVPFHLAMFSKTWTVEAAYMYFIFFGVGTLAGAVIASGGGGKPSAPKGK